MKLYKMKHLIEVTGWTRKKLSQWLQQEIVKAEVPPKRAGIAAKFSFNNIVQFIITDKLVNAGLSIRKASEIADLSITYTTLEEYFVLDPLHHEYWMVLNLENTDDHNFFTEMPNEITQDITLVLKLHPIFRDTAEKVKALKKE